MNILIENFRRQFELSDVNSRRLLGKLNNARLFQKPKPVQYSMAMFSCGEYLLRSAAAVEQTFGGITTKLWDDPFEWTLPEKLDSVGKIEEYFTEVRETREKGLAFFSSDGDLIKQIPAPEKLKTIHQIMLETLERASHFQGRAFAVFQMISDEKPPHY